MRRRRPEEERARSDPARAPSAQQSGILALQQSAGNHAVSQMIAREEQAPDSEPPTVDVDGLGVIVVDNWSRPLSPSTGAGGGAGSQRQPEEQKDLLTLQVNGTVGAHSGPLVAFMNGGKTIDSIALENRGIKMRLENVHITSYNMSEHQGVAKETWTVEGEMK